jgi:hypothetical protein
MSEYLVTYDLKDGNPGPHRDFIMAAEAEGLLYVYKPSESVMHLPNTTLWGNFSIRDAVRDAYKRALDKAIKIVGYTIKLEKRAITQISNPYFLSDESKAPDEQHEIRDLPSSSEA